jgi:protein-S-isoprenylcysteine O-methyltransferase Ste14
MIVVDKPWTLSPDMPAIFCLLLLAVTNTALAYVLYYRLLAQLGATRLSLVTYIIPISGVFWGWMILGERLGWTAFAALGFILASVATVSNMLPEVSGNSGGNSSGFDPFGWAARILPEKQLHKIIRVFMTAGCAVFLIKRMLEFDHYWVKPLWAVETAIYLVLLLAFLVRTHPVDRSQGVAEIIIPLVGALLPFVLLFSPPARFVLSNRPLHISIFWSMTLATALTVWGMWTLRRSFSITVEARELVIAGPYRFLRHPIYAGEILASTAVAFWRASWTNAVILVLFIVLQLIRARMEEEKLKRNFPEYEEYAGKVWWVWKG